MEEYQNALADGLTVSKQKTPLFVALILPAIRF
jgi:hypothetical protein